MKAVTLGLALLVVLSSSGCATILHPERSLVPKDKRGDLDIPMVLADVILSTPFFLAGLAVLAFGGGHPDLMKDSLIPLWLDSHYGTLWRPKEGE